MRNSKDHRGRTADDEVAELDFDDDSAAPPRSGEPRLAAGAEDPEFTVRRVREAGMTGGEINRDLTDDDLGPETLFEQTADGVVPTDKELRIVEAGEIGGGYGKDEAELANEQGAPE